MPKLPTTESKIISRKPQPEVPEELEILISFQYLCEPGLSDVRSSIPLFAVVVIDTLLKVVPVSVKSEPLSEN